jgi:hypothetical protein
MSNSDQLQLNGRSLELFHSGELADCVIEVQQPNDPQNKVYFLFVYIYNPN